MCILYLFCLDCWTKMLLLEFKCITLELALIKTSLSIQPDCSHQSLKSYELSSRGAVSSRGATWRLDSTVDHLLVCKIFSVYFTLVGWGVSSFYMKGNILFKQQKDHWHSSDDSKLYHQNSLIKAFKIYLLIKNFEHT